MHVTGGDSVDAARDYARTADTLLLDSCRPDAAVRELGGTGRTHDWAPSRRIVASVDRPVFLADGLTPDNPADAVDAVRPCGLDICAGLRSGGRLDPDKLRTLFGRVATGRRPQA